MVPADRGLSTLGLILQLAGSTFAAAATLLLLVTLADGGSAAIILVAALSIGRSLLHNIAGSHLLYGKPGTPPGKKQRLLGMRRYVLAGLAHSLIVGVIFESFAVVLGLMLWPACLWIVSLRFARFNDDMPLGEDKGFEGASILMTVLGLTGFALTATILLALLENDAIVAGIVFVVPLGMLLIRSVLHIQAGMSGLHETSLDRSVERVNRYADFGVTSALCAGGIMMLLVLSQRATVIGIAILCVLCWMMLAWPLIVRAYFADRQIEDLLAGNLEHRRAPDGGLTNLGWLLLAHAIFTATLLTFGEGSPASAMCVLEAWTGYELITMSARSRMVATLFGVLGALVSFYVNWPLLEAAQHVRNQRELVMIGPLVLALILPVTTLVLVHRTLSPGARARFRPAPTATP